MYLKKVLNQPNLVGTVMIALLFGVGFVYAFAFDGFNVETATGGEVEAWLAAAGGGSSGQTSCKCIVDEEGNPSECSYCNDGEGNHCGNNNMACGSLCPAPNACVPCGGRRLCAKGGGQSRCFAFDETGPAFCEPSIIDDE